MVAQCGLSNLKSTNVFGKHLEATIMNDWNVIPVAMVQARCNILLNLLQLDSFGMVADLDMTSCSTSNNAYF